MRVYAYIRIEPNTELGLEKYMECFKKYGYALQSDRILFEEVAIDTPIKYRDKIINLIKHNLEINDVLIIKSLDCLGSNFLEIKEMTNLICQKKLF